MISINRHVDVAEPIEKPVEERERLIIGPKEMFEYAQGTAPKDVMLALGFIQKEVSSVAKYIQNAKVAIKLEENCERL